METSKALDRAEAPDILSGFQRRTKTAVQLDVSERTLLRYEAKGMPVIRMGHLRLHDPLAVREWLLKQMLHEHQPAPRGRGRPRKAA